MIKVLLVALGVALCLAADEPKLHAVLVAGSNEYYNYRHQADACHAYQIMHAHGIPDERIVVMMYDDIANNNENPTKGIIINKPNGSDVYHGVPKDYTKGEVTPSNFLKVLMGEKPAKGSGKVLNAGPNDHVFVNFVDHGAPGILAFPDGQPVLTVKDLQKTLKDMADQKKFGKLVFYVEACESGSMFENKLPDNISIFATTAANSKESSYACYYDNKRETYLGDLYSVNWMEDSDAENIEQETLEKQFTITKKETNMSHCQQYGDMSISKMTVGQFQGEKNPASKEAMKTLAFAKKINDAVPSTDVPMKILEKKISAEKDATKKIALMSALKSMMENRRRFKSQMLKLANGVSKDFQQSLRLTAKQMTLNDIDCHDEVVKHFDDTCMRLGTNTYATRFVYMLVNMCEEKIPVATIKQNIDTACAPLKGINGYYL